MSGAPWLLRTILLRIPGMLVAVIGAWSVAKALGRGIVAYPVMLNLSLVHK